MSSDPGSPDESQVRIDDPEELSQTKRITELLNRRRGVIDARDEAHDAKLLGRADEEEALAYYRSRVESLIIDLWTKFDTDESELGEEYLKKRKIDTIYVPPPSELETDSRISLAPWQSLPDAKPIHIRGLRWFINHGPVVSRDFEVELWDPPGRKTVTNEMTVPVRTLDKALLACIEFMDKTGIDADMSEDEQQTKIDRELLEEVDEWREQNIQE